MNYNEKAFGLGSKRSIIREIFEYSKVRAGEIGAENVYDFSLGNPSVEPPIEVTDAIKELINSENATFLHGYTSAQGDLSVRKAIAENINKRFNLNLSPDYIYMTCGAAASLSICLNTPTPPAGTSILRSVSPAASRWTTISKSCRFWNDSAPGFEMIFASLYVITYFSFSTILSNNPLHPS